MKLTFAIPHIDIQNRIGIILRLLSDRQQLENDYLNQLRLQKDF